MAIWDWFLGQFNSDGVLKLNTICADLATEVWYKQLAIQSCINLIANTVARGEFLTYEKGVEVRKEKYYLLNVEPNQNKSASKFWRDVVSRLIYDNECLVIQQNDKFYVAESFGVKKFAFLENVYSNIVVEGLTLSGSMVESQVFHFELHNEKIRNIIEGLYGSYAKLISASQGNYKKSRSKRGTLELESAYPQTPKAQEELNNLLDVRFKRFFDAEGNAVIPLARGMKYTELTNGTTTAGSTESRDIRSLIDDIFDFTAIGFQVPPQLLRGMVADTDKAVNSFLTFCINAWAELLADEVNRKWYGKEAFLSRTYTKLDTSNIRAVDIKDIANALDILERIGAYSIDDSLKILGKEPLGTEWSRSRWMTKNYENIEQRMKGGEVKNEKV
jgi:HK97 family phage portal protein